MDGHSKRALYTQWHYTLVGIHMGLKISYTPVWYIKYTSMHIVHVPARVSQLRSSIIFSKKIVVDELDHTEDFIDLAATFCPILISSFPTSNGCVSSFNGGISLTSLRPPVAFKCKRVSHATNISNDSEVFYPICTRLSFFFVELEGTLLRKHMSSSLIYTLTMLCGNS